MIFWELHSHDTDKSPSACEENENEKKRANFEMNLIHPAETLTLNSLTKSRKKNYILSSVRNLIFLTGVLFAGEEETSEKIKSH